MKHKKWLITLIITVLSTLLVISLVYKNIIIDPVYNRSQFEFSSDDTILISGSSRAASSFNPEIIHGSVNAASAGECFFYTYYKLVYLLGIKNNFKKVVIAYSPCNLPANTDFKLYNGQDTKNYFDKYFAIVDSEGKKILKKSFQNHIVYQLKYELGVPFSYNEDFKLFLHKIRGNFKPDHFDFFGGYTNSTRIDTSLNYTNEKIKFYFYNENKVADISAINESYLKKIALFCESNHLELFLVSVPVHNSFRKLVPETFVKEHLRLSNEIMTNFKTAKYIDLSNVKMCDTCWSNGDHVNNYGARLLSDALYAIIANNRSDN